MRYDFIKNNEKIFPIEKMCQVLRVSSSGYYRWKNKTISNRVHKMNLIKEKIVSIYFESKQRYGSLRMTFELQNLGYEISRPESFARTGEAKYMKQLGFEVN